MIRAVASWVLVAVWGLAFAATMIGAAVAVGWAVGIDWVFILAAVGVVFLAFDAARWIRRATRWIRWRMS